MRIRRFIWSQEQVEHIARHGIRPEEFEEVCFGHPLAMRVKSRGQNPVYNMFGRTTAGRYLLCVVIQYPDGNGYPITARSMTENERRRFRRWSQR